MPTPLQDLSQAIRGLRKRPGFTLAALVTLAVGIGANVTVFSFVNALLLRPLPFGDRSDRVVTLHSTHRLQPEDWADSRLSYRDLIDVRAQAAGFEDVAGFVARNFTVTTEADAERLQGESVTTNLFDMLGVQPLLGRTFVPGEAAPIGLETSVILTHGLWQRRFGADAGIIGRAVIINDRARTVVGVMPPGFKFPERAELYMPFRADEIPRSGRSVAAIAVLRHGVWLAQAQSELDAIASRLETSYPETNRGFGIRALRFRDSQLGGDDRLFTGTLMAAVGFVLLIACANLANLLLVRSAARQRELAVRAALGASRRRLVWGVMAESVVLAVAGTSIGMMAAIWAVDSVRMLWPEELPYWIRLDVDGRIVVFTIIVMALTAMAIGLLPALRASRPDVVGDLKESSRGVSLGPTAQRTQGVLVAVQVALCLALLVGANLMIRSFLSLQRADLGFDDKPILTLRVYLSGDAFDEPKARAVFFDRAVEATRQVTGVNGAVVTSSIPGDDGGSPVRLVTDDRLAPGDEIAAQVVTITDDFFNTLALRLIEGRAFTRTETTDPAASVAIINQRLAARLWPGESPVGRRIGFSNEREIEWLRIVGVSPNVQYEEFGEETDQSRLNVYVPYAKLASRTVALLVRSQGDPAAIHPLVRDALHRLNRSLPVYDVRTMRDVRRFTTWEQQFFGVMMGAFATTALLLACLGVYALLAYAARRRAHEIGVRLALGAEPRDVVSLFVWQGSRVGLVGLAAGAVLALIVARVLSGTLYEVNVFDPWLFLSTGSALLAVVLAASYLPARRAARVDPSVALRVE